MNPDVALLKTTALMFIRNLANCHNLKIYYIFIIEYPIQKTSSCIDLIDHCWCAWNFHVGPQDQCDQIKIANCL